MNQRRVATLLLIAGVLLTSISIGLLIRNVVPAFAEATSATAYETPVSLLLPLKQTDYVLWVQDSASGTASVFGDDFKIADDSGQALAFRAVTNSEILSRGDGSFVAELAFTVPRAGNYTVAVRSDVATRVVISRDFFRRVVANVGWVGGVGVGLLGVVVGAVLLIVDARRRRRRREHDAFVAAYGFPPGYGPPPMASYGPSNFGPPPAYPGAPLYPGSSPAPAAFYPQPLDPTLGAAPGGTAASLPYPGWYPDPEDRSRYRWWSGTAWESSFASEDDIS